MLWSSLASLVMIGISIDDFFVSKYCNDVNNSDKMPRSSSLLFDAVVVNIVGREKVMVL